MCAAVLINGAYAERRLQDIILSAKTRRWVPRPRAPPTNGVHAESGLLDMIPSAKTRGGRAEAYLYFGRVIRDEHLTEVPRRPMLRAPAVQLLGYCPCDAWRGKLVCKQSQQ